MKSNVIFDFKINKETKEVYIVREFDAGIDLVWAAFTQAELLDKWVAPLPLKAKTKYMNFKVGGRRFWAMVDQKGNENWMVEEFLSITPKFNFKKYNTFADENENRQLPGSEWDFSFKEENGNTKVEITIYNESIDRMMMQLEHGFKEGYSNTLENLDQLLSTLKGSTDEK